MITKLVRSFCLFILVLVVCSISNVNVSAQTGAISLDQIDSSALLTVTSSQELVEDTICGSGEFLIGWAPPTLCDGYFDFPFFGLPKGNFIYRRTVAPPYIPNQVVPIELVKFRAVGLYGYWDTPVIISENPDYSSTGEIIVDSVDESGDFFSGEILLDLYLNFIFFDSFLLHNEEPLDMRGEVNPLYLGDQIPFNDGPGAQILYDSNGVASLSICSLYMSARFCPCCIGYAGDINNDGSSATILDLTFLVDYMFRGGTEPICTEHADLNRDGSPANILDLTFLVDYIFRGGSGPPYCF